MAKPSGTKAFILLISIQFVRPQVWTDIDDCSLILVTAVSDSWANDVLTLVERNKGSGGTVPTGIQVRGCSEFPLKFPIGIWGCAAMKFQVEIKIDTQRKFSVLKLLSRPWVCIQQNLRE